MSLLFVFFVTLVLLWLVALCGSERFLLLIAAPMLLFGTGFLLLIRAVDANNKTIPSGAS